MKLSVIIPAFNEEKYIKKCLSSIASQKTSFPFEVIVVDNNSIDRTMEIAKTFDVKILSEKNQGTAHAKNLGVKSAQGEIILTLDADCFLPIGYLERIVTFLENNPNSEAFAGSYCYYDGSKLLKSLTSKGVFYWFYFFLTKLFFRVQVILGGNFVARKSIFKKVKFSTAVGDITNFYPEDTVFAIDAKKSNIKIISKPDFFVYTSSRRSQASSLEKSFRRFMTHLKLLWRSLFVKK